MNGDPKVVAALAIAILALPPVVNAIMAKAAEQADTSWLRDQDFDGNPDIDDPPPLEHRPPPGETPPPEDQEPPDRPPPQEQCEQFTEPETRRLEDGVSDATGSLTLQLIGNDRTIGASIASGGVTGTPRFELTRDGEFVWGYGETTLGTAVNENYQEPDATAPEEWVLSYDLTGVVYDPFQLALFTNRCEVPSDA